MNKSYIITVHKDLISKPESETTFTDFEQAQEFFYYAKTQTEYGHLVKFYEEDNTEGNYKKELIYTYLDTRKRNILSNIQFYIKKLLSTLR